jgi:hypothetical protein
MVQTLALIVVMFGIDSTLFSGPSIQAPSAAPTPADQSQDSSLLQPNDSEYSDAMEFALFLRNNGFIVHSLHRSKMNGFIRGVDKAALIRTDNGVLEVMFFPAADGAEKVQVLEEQKGGRYLYSFRGQPDPTPGDSIDSNRPQYFILRRNLFIITDDQDLYTKLKTAFKLSQ